MKEKKKGKSFRLFFGLTIFIFFVSLAFLFAIPFFSKNGNALAPTGHDTGNSNTSIIVTEASSNANQNINTLSPDAENAKKLYDEGITLFNEKKYEAAIDKFSAAIELNQSEPNYFSKKSQAQKNLKQDEEAINTIRAGLKSNPDSDLLKTRLDILEKQWLGSQQQ